MLHSKFQAPEPSSFGEEDFKYILFSYTRPPPQGHLKKFVKGLLDNASFYSILSHNLGRSSGHHR